MITPAERVALMELVEQIREAITPHHGNPGRKERAVLKACRKIEELVR